MPVVYKKLNILISKTMKKQIIYLLFAILLIALICYIKFCTVSAMWLKEWGVYALLAPILVFLAATFEKKFNYRHLISVTAGILIGVLSNIGDWADRHIIQKAVATILGALISWAIIHFGNKK